MSEERKTVEKPRSERSREPTDFIRIHMRVTLLHNGARRVIVPIGKLVGSFMREGRLGVAKGGSTVSQFSVTAGDGLHRQS